ncbi:GNAT family N-acetyltransferase [Oceanisphaera profunda]|uniref:tRNA(Met) cytidine acetyltransferase TmcA n=1 Tax=Oceanisphaera profunda TaxID=1416627 RepID=A0A1Y0D6J8_9GAMM|nr:GNAT family N-acetyltransferase [Oceanisphaera profunda]ART83150.1 GNAT family N-acetyltransferase [Oceanisphaera profunda]
MATGSFIDNPLMPSPLTADHLVAWQTWRQQLCQTGERRLLVMAGEQDWAMAQAQQLTCSEPNTLWLGQALGSQAATATNKFKTVLGQAYGALVVNAFSGLHPDALAAVAGTLMAGGVLILLCPPLAHWPQYADPDLVRYVAEPEQAKGLHSRFLSRFMQILQQDTQVLHWPQGAAFPTLPLIEKTPPWQLNSDRQGCLNDQQRHALAVLLHSARRRIPVILTADRGRGKSSVLGLTASRLLKAGLRVLLTAPSPHAVSQVLAHCAQPLVFMAPDALLAERPPADILLIDEAAAIPVALLLRLARQYCCVFASTEHGYEGTGLGFQLKFQPQLLRMQPRTQKVQLRTPARWSSTDPLEPLLFRLLALNAVAVTPTRHGKLTIRWVNQDQLLNDDMLLSQLFGLLTLAHYQTSPSDLRQLLDAPELHLAVMFRQSTPVAVALLISEGQTHTHPLTADLSLAIWRGQRRPRGHLLPQSLAFHGGLSEACQFHYHRVMRIVVHPDCQHAGLGSQLLTWLQQQMQPTALSSPAKPVLTGDFIGTSFGASPELIKFWQANGFSAVRLGQSRDAVSGLQAVMMLWPSSAAAKLQLPLWQGQFSANVHRHPCATPPLSSDSSLTGDDTCLIADSTCLVENDKAAIYQALTLLPPSDTRAQDRQIAHDFAFYHRDLSADQAALARFVASHTPLKPLSNSEQRLLAALLATGAQPTLVAKEWQLSGYKAAISQCRQLMQAFF